MSHCFPHPENNYNNDSNTLYNSSIESKYLIGKASSYTDKFGTLCAVTYNTAPHTWLVNALTPRLGANIGL